MDIGKAMTSFFNTSVIIFQHFNDSLPSKTQSLNKCMPNVRHNGLTWGVDRVWAIRYCWSCRVTTAAAFIACSDGRALSVQQRRLEGWKRVIFLTDLTVALVQDSSWKNKYDCKEILVLLRTAADVRLSLQDTDKWGSGSKAAADG